MPNWCFTDVAVKGDEQELTTLYDKMRELENMDKARVENGFGSTWLGCLIDALGGDWKEIYCRGWWSNLDGEEGQITFSIESAWSPSTEVFDFLEKKFPSLKIHYYAEEEANGVFVTNDTDSEFFSQRFIAKICNEDNDYTEEYFEEKEDAISWLSDLADREIKTEEELKKYDEELQEQDADYYCYIQPIEVVA